MDYIFEASWEVCNKMGGIYTVLSSKARTLQADFPDKIIFIGPDLNNQPIDFEEDRNIFPDWKKSLQNIPDGSNYKGLKVRIGRWKIPGNPIVFLVSYKTFFDRRDKLYYEMWETFGVDSTHAYGDYDESCIFAYTTALAIESFYKFYKLDSKQVAALFNEWMLGMGALYIKKHIPKIATLFTTHATTTGRSIAGNGKNLYGYMDGYNGDQMSTELNVEAKHSLEKHTAQNVDCFTTVSDITAIECKQLLEITPTVTPNGFEKDFVPTGAKYEKKRADARKRLLLVAEKLLGQKIDNNAFLISTCGRYEYRNKGIDIFIDTMNSLRKSGNLQRETIAFLMIPAWVYAARSDLKLIIEKDYTTTTPMQTPFLTHWLNNMNEDKIMNFIFSSGFSNAKDEKLKIIFVPCYLDGRDGIFNMTYYDLLIGMDATVFASYYEPWGYTPHESVAFGIPTITTNLSGFGMWAKKIVSGNNIEEGVAVLNRTDDNYFELVENIARQLLSLMTKDAKTICNNCFKIAAQAEWKKFIEYYYKAFDKAFDKANARIKSL